MKLFRTQHGILLEYKEAFFIIAEAWDTLINRDDLEEFLLEKSRSAVKLTPGQKEDWLCEGSILAPIINQEIWAAGVTYLRSKDARMEESQSSGAASLYDRVYDAERPELFFKSTAARVAAPYQPIYIRKDSEWNVPEPELTLFINSKGIIQGYTAGNDVSSRSIEGENALYLPQAKIYEKSAAIGPCIYITSQPLSRDTAIKMSIVRDDITIYSDETSISRIKRSFEELASYLFRECEFPNGCFLMTGTCLVPADNFTLQPGDVVNITIDNIGTLTNTVSLNPLNI